MANPYRGEVVLVLNGEACVMRLTLGSLVALEDASGPLIPLVERFETGQTTSRDVAAVLLAGLRGGGWKGGPKDLELGEIEGGYLAALSAAILLLRRGFSGGHHDD